MDIHSDESLVKVRVLNNKLDLDNKYGVRDRPIKDSLSLTTTEYREFVSNFSYAMNALKNWLNANYFGPGLLPPWRLSEFSSKLYF
jgi:hypothetical protein